MTQNTTVIIHVFNEEYLLPFWLHHHKDLFDHGILIDYNSTDTSVDLCRQICPHWTILTTKNKDFNATRVDEEVMSIESQLNGIKLVLNVTEFLILETPFKQLFKEYVNQPVAFRIPVNTPYSLCEYRPKNHIELMKHLLDSHVSFHQDRHNRFVHSYIHGNYILGRHRTNHDSIPVKDAHILWMGFYPLNESLLKRKLQIKQNIPEYDRVRSYGIQHLLEKEQMLQINLQKAMSGITLQQLNPTLYQYLCKKYL
jgi:hypothetical protein